MRAVLLVCFLYLAGCSADESVLRMALPKTLKEVSGLAPYGNDLIAIADEKARLYRISFDQESVTRVGAFGDPPEKGDFEGIALANENVYAITSDGLLYTKSLGTPDSEYAVADTQFGELCEIEGLDYMAGLLYVLCKTPYADELQEHLSILVWDPVQQARVLDQEIRLHWRDLGLPKNKLHPSGMVITANTLFVIAARERLWVKVDLGSSAAVVGRLSKSHEQAEGIAILAGATYIADEGKKRGSVTRYEGVF